MGAFTLVLDGIAAEDICLALLSCFLLALPAVSQGPCPLPCVITGCRGDPELNRQKNRTAEPNNYRRYTFSQFTALNDKAVKKKGRDNWTSEEKDRIAQIENEQGATLVGYIYDATQSDPEASNCFREEPAWRDFHIWIVHNPMHATKPESIVVEITPRIRKKKSSWKLDKLRDLIPPHKWVKVRVKGYLFFDDEHWDFPTRTPPVRATACEIHPITEFEVCSAGTACSANSSSGWVELEDM